MEELTQHQAAVVDAIHREFHEHSRWPMFSAIDRPFRRTYGIDTTSIIAAMPDSLVLLPHPGPARPSSNDLIRLSLRGLTFCEEAGEDMDRFAATLRFLAKYEQEYEPGPAGEEPTVHAAQIREFLGLDYHGHAALARLYLMLQLDYWGTNLSGGVSASQWSITLGPEVWRFRNVESVEDCLRVREDWKAEAQAMVALRPNPYGYTLAAAVTELEPAKDDPYVDEKTIKRLQDKLDNGRYDLSKLLALIDELDDSHAGRKTYSCLALIRTIMNHVPPVFGESTFDAVANNVSWGESRKKYVNNLASYRPLADEGLHAKISVEHDVLSFGDVPPPAGLRAVLMACAARL